MSHNTSRRWVASLTILLLLAAGWVQMMRTPAMPANAQGLTYDADINKSFSPNAISAGGTSRLSVVIYNPNTFPLTLSSSPPAWSDTLDPTLSFAVPANIFTDCGGTVTTIGKTLSLVGGSVPAKAGTTSGSCTVSVDVTSKTPGNIDNIIAAGALRATNPDGSIQVTNPTLAKISLLVNSVQPPSLSKGFNPNTMWTGRSSQLTITVRNNDVNTSLTSVSLTDSLPAGVVVANPANASTTCNGSTNGSVEALPGAASIRLDNATVPQGGSCQVVVTVTSTTPGIYSNLIPANSLQSQQGVTNTSAASAPLNVQSIGIAKSFSPSNFQNGGVSTLTVLLQNPTATDYHDATFTDHFPTGLIVANPANASTTCSGGVVTATPGAGLIALSGGVIPPGNPGGCQVTVDVTSLTPASYTNILPRGALTTLEGASNIVPAVANISVYGTGLGLSGSKSFSPGYIPVGGRSRLSVAMRAPADIKLTSFSLVDALPLGVVVDAIPAASTSGCSGAPGDAAAVFSPQAGDTQLSLSNASILPDMTCTLNVYVTSDAPGVYRNTVSPANISNAQNRNMAGTVSADLTVSGLTVGKNFSPTTVNPDGISTMTIVLGNNNPNQLDDVTFSDRLPVSDPTNGVFLAADPHIVTTCGTPDIISIQTDMTSGAQTITMTGGVIPAQVDDVPGVCTVSVDVVGIGRETTYTNSIGSHAIQGTIHQTGVQITNPYGASATLGIRPIRIDVVKGFDPVSVIGGSVSTLTIHLSNPTSVVLDGIHFTDHLPSNSINPGRGMRVASPPNASVGTCGGSLSANTGDDFFTFSGGRLAPNATCQVSLHVTMNSLNNLTNVILAGEVTTLNGAQNAQDASATLTNQVGASVSKIFGPNPVFAGGNSTLTITIQNLANVQLTGVGLVDVLPAGLSAQTPVESQCNGGSVTVNGNEIRLSGATLDDLATCSVVIPVTAPVSGSYQNCIAAGALENTENARNAAPACDTLTVLAEPQAPLFQKVFSPHRIALDDTASLTFTLNNPSGNALPLTDIGFTDIFPAGMTLASVPNAVQCNGGAVTYTSDSITLTGGSIPVNGVCTVLISVRAANPGEYANTSGAHQWSYHGTPYSGSTASDSLTVVAAPVIAKAFTPAVMQAGEESTLRFTISNPAGNSVPLTGVRFTDVLPAGMRIAANPQAGVTGCDAASIPVLAAAAGDVTLSLSSASIAVGSTCTLQVNVTAGGGNYVNTTSVVVSDNGGTGNHASATLTVDGGGLLLEKTSTNASFQQVGDTIHYDYRLSNTGSVALLGTGPSGQFVVSDDKAVVTCPAGITRLEVAPDPASSVVCSADYTVVNGDMITRQVTNLASAAAQDESNHAIVSNDASLTLRLAELTLQKLTTTAAFRVENDAINYQYILTNSGEVDLFGDGPAGQFMVTDDHFGSAFVCDSSVTHLSPGANVTCSGTHTYRVTAGDLAAGLVTNIAFATAQDQPSGGVAVQSNDDQVSVFLVVPATIAKTFEAPKSIAVGGISRLTITITNPSSNVVPLTGVSFVDNLVEGLEVAAPPDPYQCGGQVSATGRQITLTDGVILPNDACSIVVQITGLATGVYDNTTGPVTSSNGGPGSISNTDTLQVIAPPVITKAFVDMSIVPGGTTTATFVITNPNAGSALTQVAFNDTLLDGLQVANSPAPTLTGCGALSGLTFGPALPPYTQFSFTNGSIVAGGTCVITVPVTASNPGVKYNTTGSISSVEGGQGAPSNTASLTVINPHLSLVKTIFSGPTYDTVGGTITYHYQLTNDGNVTLIGNGLDGRFTIIDDQMGDPKGTPFLCPPTPAGLAPGASLTCSAVYIVTQDDVDNGSITNQASGHGLYDTIVVDTNLDSKTATAIQRDSLTLMKTATAGSPYSSVGTVIQYLYTLTNSGNVSLTGTGPGGRFVVTDDKLSALDCPATPTKLGQGQSITCTASYSAVTQADLDFGSVSNTATGYADWKEKHLVDESSLVVNANQQKILTLTKEITSGRTYFSSGSLIFYRYILKNDGNVTLQGTLPGVHFTVIDNRINGSAPFDCGAVTSLAPGESVTCYATDSTVAGDVSAGSVTNYATGHALFGAEEIISNQASQTATRAATWNVGLAKTIENTELNTVGNDHTQGVIGELLTYRIVATIPEGTIQDAQLADTLDAGLAFVDLVSVTASNLDDDGESILGDDGLNLTGMAFDAAGVCSNCSAGVSAGTSNPLVTSSGRVVTFNFGRIVNTNTDATPETITIVYRAVVLNQVSNQTGTQVNNSAVFSWRGSSRSASAPDMRVVEPSIAISKSALPTSAFDAGDVLQYTIVLSPSVTTAYDVTFSDPLPAQLVAPSITSVTGGALSDFEISGCPAACVLQTTASADIDLAPSAAVTIVISGTLDGQLAPATQITNTAAVTWSSLNGDVTARSAYNPASVERTGSDGIGGALNDYSSTVSSTVTSDALGIVKSFVSSSEDATPGNHLAIGEVVRFRLVVRIPEGTATNLRLVDALPSGLLFLDNTSAVLALVATDTTQLNSSTLTDPGYKISGDESTIAGIVPTQILPPEAITGGPFDDGDDVTFLLGDITNSNTNAHYEYAVIEFNALVSNVAGNQAFNNATGAVTNTTRTNTFSAFTTTSSVGVSNSVPIQIAEAVINNLTKTITTSPSDAGDNIVYRLAFSNSATGANAIPAFDVHLTDNLPAAVVCQSVVVQTQPAEATVTGADCAGSSLDITFSQVNPGSSVVVQITARVIDAAQPGMVITNSAKVFYSSLPGTGGTCPNATNSCTPGAGGDIDGERNDSIGSGGPNDYSINAAVSVTLAQPAIVKSVAAPTYTMGELVTYRLLVTLPEGTIRNLAITDHLPAGLQYTGYSIIRSGAPLSGTFAGILTDTPTVNGGAASGDAVTFTFGDSVVLPDNDSSTNQFVLEVIAGVVNEIGNQGGGTRSNQADLTFTNAVGNPTTIASGSVNITLTEPALTLTKTIQPPSTGLDAGDLVTYHLTLTNGNGANVSTAYDVVLNDALPGFLIPGSVTVTPSAGSVVSMIGNDLTVTIDTLARNASVTIDVSGTLVSTVPPGQVINNQAHVTYTSLPGASSSERTGEDGIGGLNDYYAGASVSLTTDLPTMVKSVDALEYTIGDLVTYRLLVTLPEGVIESLLITDFLPSGLRYVDYRVILTGAPLSGTFNGSLTGTPIVTGGAAMGDAVTFNFGDSVVANDNVSTTDQFVLEITARVVNDGLNLRGETPTNSAELNYVDPNHPGLSASVLASPVSFTIVEPLLDLSKVVLSPVTPPDAGDVVTYRITVSNSSGANVSTAYDLDIQDTLAPEFIPGAVVVSPAAGSSYTWNGNLLRVLVDSLAPGSSLTIDVAGELTQASTAAQTIHNSAAVTYTSLSGENPEKRNGSQTPAFNDYFAQDSVDIITGAPTLAKSLFSSSEPSTSGPLLTIGEVATYRLDVNLGEGTINSLQVVDSLPAGMTFVPGSVALDTSALGGSVPVPGISVSPDQRTVTIQFGTITITNNNNPNDNSFGILLQARVQDVPGNRDSTFGQTVLTNQASLRVNGGSDIPSNTTAILVVEPRMSIEKTVSPALLRPNDTVTITLTARNTGSSDAFDVVVSDILADEYYSNIYPLITADGFTYAAVHSDNETTVTFSGGTIAHTNGTATFSFAAQIRGNVANSTLITNTGTITQATTLPLDGIGERDEPDVSDSKNLTIQIADVAITKSDGIAGIQPGQLAVYSVVVSVANGVPAGGVVLTETVPPHTTFVAASSSAAWNCPDGSVNPAVCTLNVGQVAPAVPQTFTFAVRIDNPLSSATEIVNTATAADDGLHGSDPNSANNSATDSDALQTASLGDLAWLDSNANGLQNSGEVGVDGVTVTLTWGGPDNDLSTASNNVTYPSVLTAGGGLYSFTGLPGGVFQVAFTAPDASIPYFISPLGGESLANPSTGVTSALTLVAGEHRSDVDAGFYQHAALGDRVWLDVNANGIQDNDELGLADVSVQLLDSAGNLVGTTTTDPLGNYRFTDLVPGDYHVQVIPPAGYQVSPIDQGSDNGLDSDVNPITGRSALVSLASNETNLTLDMGLYQWAELGNFVWNDLNFNGIQEAGENGIANVAIDLLDATNAVVASTTTGVNGEYSFANLIPGNYRLVFHLPDGYTFSPQGEGSDRGLDSDPSPTNGQTDVITLISNETNARIDAGMYLINRALTLVKSATPMTYASVGTEIQYSFLLTNTGNVPLSGPFTISDDQTADESCPAGDLAVGASMTCTASHTITLDDLNHGSLTNTATAANALVTSPSSSVTVNAVQSPLLTIVKSSTTATVTVAGQVVPYSYLVSNTGNITITGIALTDDHVDAPPSCSATSLAPAASMTCTAQYTTTQADLDGGGMVRNLATLTSANAPTVTDSLEIPIQQEPALTIQKSAAPLTYAAVGDVIQYTYLVTNSGNVTLNGPFTVDDDKAADESCPVGNLAPNASMTCTATYTILQSDLDAGLVTNVATASNGTVISASDQATVTAQQSPALSIQKTANLSLFSDFDTVIQYQYTLRNEGNVTLAAPFTVEDDRVSVVCPATPLTLAPQATLVCTGEDSVTQDDLNFGSITNVASGHARFAGQPVDSPQVSLRIDALQIAQLTLDKQIISGNPYSQIGDVIVYHYVLTNSGNQTLMGTGADGEFTVSDDKVTVTCPLTPTSLDAGESVTCSASYTVEEADLLSSVVNTAVGHYLYLTTPYDTNEDTETASGTHLLASKLASDVDEDGLITPGDTLEYTVVVTNTGLAIAEGITFRDTPDAHTSLVVGSVTTTQGSVVRGNNAGDASVEVDLGTLAGPDGTATITFRVVISPAIPADVTSVSNQGLFSGSNFPAAPTDNQTEPRYAGQQPTVTHIDGRPNVSVTKAARLAVDADLTENVSPGDTLEYTVVVRNGGTAPEYNLVFTDMPDANTDLVVGSVTTTQGAVVVGNLPGDKTVTVEIGTLDAAGGEVIITLRVIIHDPLPDSVTSVQNQGNINGRATLVDTDDPDTSSPGDPTLTPVLRPTAVTLIYFNYMVLPNHQIELSWATASEIDNYGFKIKRAQVDDYHQATEVVFIPSQLPGGSGGEAHYQYIDSVPNDGPWIYWLVDVDTHNVETVHAKSDVLSCKTEKKIFVPRITR